jgi:hypothetical protein
VIEPGDFVLYRFQSDIPVAPPVDVSTGAPLPWKFGGEVMWVLVTDVSRGLIYGRLASSPLAVPMQEDQRVTVPVNKIEGHRRGGLANRAFYKILRWASPAWAQGAKA